MTKIFKTIAVAALVAASAVPALARTATEAQSITVITADLNLSTQAGRDRLDHRIDRAARQVCGFNSNSRDLGAQFHARTCMAGAKLAATRQIEGRNEVAIAMSKGR